MPEIGNWRQQIKGGLGPLLRIMGAMNDCLVVLIRDNPVGTTFPGGGSIVSGTKGKCLQVSHASVNLRLMIVTTRRGIRSSDRIQFEDASGEWVFSDQRTDDELVAVQNAIRASLGIPPWDPVREPWGVNL